MFSRFTPLALISAFQPGRAVREGRRTYPARRAPDHRTRPRARLRLEGLEERYLLSGISAITEFTIPSPKDVAPFGITTGPDGNLWFTDTGDNAIGMINPTTDAITEFALPTADAQPYAIVAGPDGNLRFTELYANNIGMINPTTHAITEFALPSVKGAPNKSAYPRGITVGPDGNLWFAEELGNKIGEINPTTHAIHLFAVPTANSDPWGITAGPDGNLWFTEYTISIGQIGEINPTTHVISELPNPSPDSRLYGITAGPDGNLWFTNLTSGTVGMINPTTHATREFSIPTFQSDPEWITAGSDGNLWYTEGSGKIGMINPTTDAITEYPVPDSLGPAGITTGPDGNLWFADSDVTASTGATEYWAIGVATRASSELAVTQQPPANVTAGSAFGLTVNAEDSSGNLFSCFNGTVTVTLADPVANETLWGATLGGTLSVTASNGVATFSDLSLTRAAYGCTLVFSADGLGEGVANAITVTPAAPSQVAITQQQPASVTADTGFGLQASIEDAYGNVVPSDDDTVNVTLANNPDGATLGGTTSVTASQGVAAFTGLTLTAASSGYTLEVSSSGLSSATTSAITVTPAAATQVVITQQPPASVVVSTGFGLQASVEDAYGNVVTSASNTVKVALANNPTGAKLGGTLSVKASKGVAAFSGLRLNKVGTGYTLAVSSSGLTGATTSPITVTSTGADIVLSAPPGSSPPDPLLAPLVLDSPDLWDGLGLKKRAR